MNWRSSSQSKNIANNKTPSVESLRARLSLSEHIFIRLWPWNCNIFLIWFCYVSDPRAVYFCLVDIRLSLALCAAHSLSRVSHDPVWLGGIEHYVKCDFHFYCVFIAYQVVARWEQRIFRIFALCVYLGDTRLIRDVNQCSFLIKRDIMSQFIDDITIITFTSWLEN